MAILTGADGAFSFQGTLIAQTREWSLEVQRDKRETTPLNVHDKTYTQVLRSASGTAVVWYDPTVPTIAQLFNRILANELAGSEFGFIFNASGGQSLEADCLIDRMSIPMTVGDVMACSFGLTVNGAIRGLF